MSCASPKTRRSAEDEVDENPDETDPREDHKSDVHGSDVPLSAEYRASDGAIRCQ